MDTRAVQGRALVNCWMEVTIGRCKAAKLVEESLFEVCFQVNWIPHSLVTSSQVLTNKGRKKPHTEVLLAWRLQFKYRFRHLDIETQGCLKLLVQSI